MPGFPLPDPLDPRSPVAPVPVAPRPMRYAPAYLGRPAPVSAVGGIGIVIGILGIIVSLVLFCVAGGLISVSASTAQHARQFASTALPVSKPEQPVMTFVTPAPVEPGADGLIESDRRMIVQLLERTVALTPQQQQQLDALLREAGARMFPPPVPSNDAGMSHALVDHGTMPAANLASVPAVFLVTVGGRVELHDDVAVFRPTRGSSTIRVNAGPHLNSTGHPILRPQDVDAIIGLVRQASSGKLNSSQSQTLSELLASPDQQLVALNGPADSQTIGISGAGVQPGGYLLVGFAGGSLLLAPSGKPVFAGDALPGVSVAACIGMMGMATVGAGMAIWLIVLSRRLLKHTLLTPRLHRRWAMTKIMTSIVSAILFGWMIDTFSSSRPNAGTSGYFGIVAGIALGVVGCVFPALAMVLFRSAAPGFILTE